MLRSAAVIVILSALCFGCVDTYEGTRMEMNIVLGSGMDGPDMILPSTDYEPGDESYFSHYELFAEIEGNGFARLAAFLIQPAVSVNHPCLQYLEDRFCIPHGYECDPYINMERFANLEEIFLVVSPAVTSPTDDATGNTYGYEHYPGYRFQYWPDELFVDPLIEDPVEKLMRANLRQEEVEDFCANRLPEGYFVGNPIQLTAPKHGDLFGVVDGPDPRTGYNVGGFTLWTKGKLHRLTQIFLTKERDPGRLSEDNINDIDLLPGPGSQVFLAARADGSIGRIDREKYRGVTYVTMRSPAALPVTMYVTIYKDIDKNPINF